MPAMASLRFNRQTAVFASQASQLPQAERCARNLQFPPQPLWERACPRWHPCGLTDRPQCLHRRQASSHRQSGARTICNSPPTFVGAGLPAMVSLRCAGQTASSASQASQLPQVIHRQQNLCLARSLCGSGLARDGSTAVSWPDRVASIAGKPAPTGFALPAEPAAWQDLLWVRACSRWHPCGVPARPRRQHRRQASSHRFCGAAPSQTTTPHTAVSAHNVAPYPLVLAPSHLLGLAAALAA